MKLLPLVLVFMLAVASFAQVLDEVQVQDLGAVKLSDAPKVSDGFNLSNDLFKNIVITAAGKSVDPVENRGNLKQAFISSAGQDLASVNLKSDLGEFRYFKGRYAPVFSSCVWMTCTIIYEATPTVDYKYQVGDFAPNIDVANGKFNVVSISYNYSQDMIVPVTRWVNLTGKFAEVKTTQIETVEGWTDISTLKQKANVPNKIKLVVSRAQLGQTADIQPRAYGSLISQWGIYTDPNWGTTDCIVDTVGSNVTITATNGTCTVNWTSSQTIMVMVVAGGGGGGSQIGGGAGAGGYLTNYSFVTGITNYTLEVGIGGTGAAAGGGAVGTNGGDSWFANLTAAILNATGGGYGGSQTGGPGANGGSGGGGSYYKPGNTNASGTGIAGQGNNGGDGLELPGRTSGGGGGSSDYGKQGVNAGPGGSGGAGNTSNLSGTNINYACGGGGGYDAQGGTIGIAGCSTAGNGGDATIPGQNGVNGTGSGGGGGGITGGSNGGMGGYGIIILNFLPIGQNATNMATVGTGVNPINTNSLISWNATASTTGGVFGGFNCSLYVNAANTSSLNYTCNGGFCANSTDYGVLNSSPSTYSIGDQLILSCRAYTTDSVLNSTYLNSSSYTVVDNEPIITNLLIAANSTVNTIYSTMTINGNVTAQDNDTSQTLTASYSWYKNGANQTALAGTLTLFNGTFNTTPLNCITVGCAAGDSWIFGVQVNDTLNWTANLNTTPTVISAFISNLTMNTTSNQILYDLYSTNSQINFTVAPGITVTGVSATLNGSGSIFAGTLQGSSSGGAQQWNVSIQPPFSGQTNNYTLTWNITSSSITQSNTSSYNLTVNASGFYACNSTINTPSINYNFFDQGTLAPVNATMTATFSVTSSNGSVKTINYHSTTNTTQTVCIGPASGNFSAIVSESVNASGYTTVTQIEAAQFYNSIAISRPIGLVNTSAGAYYTFEVVNPFSSPIIGASIQGVHFITANNTWSSIGGATTDSLGRAIFFLIPATLYNFTVSANGFSTVVFPFTPAAQTTVQIQLSNNQSFNLTGFNSIFNDTAYSIVPNSGYYNSTQIINYTISSTNSSLTSWGMNIYKTTGSNNTLVFNSTSTVASGGVMSYSAAPVGTYHAYIWFIHSAQSNYTDSRMYYITNQTQGIMNIQTTLAANNCAAISGWAFYFIALVVALLIGSALFFVAPGASPYGALLVLWAFTAVAPPCMVILTQVPIVTPLLATIGLTIITALVVYQTSYGA
jgi:hypothetical protein